MHAKMFQTSSRRYLPSLRWFQLSIQIKPWLATYFVQASQTDAKLLRGEQREW
jgi:hypothetical protein